MSPLLAVIKQGDFKAIKSLLLMKASPTVHWEDKGDRVLPLEEAVWLGHENISRLLVENGASNTKIWDFGALHGAIERKMFALVRLLINKGASLDLIYSGRTPLCCALTCGKKGMGDVRMVNLLLSAKANLSKRTAGPRNSDQTRKLTHLEVAEKYSNEKCVGFISDKVQ